MKRFSMSPPGQAAPIVYCIDKKDVIDYATVGSFPLSPSFQINSRSCLLVSEKVKRIRLNQTKKASPVCISSRFYSPDCEETGSKRGRARQRVRERERGRETESLGEGGRTQQLVPCSSLERFPRSLDRCSWHPETRPSQATPGRLPEFAASHLSPRLPAVIDSNSLRQISPFL